MNKKHSLRYGHVPPKLVIMTPWRALCIDLVGPYTLKGKDSSSIDCMCLTKINPATSWFEIVELPIVRVTVPKGGIGEKATCLDYTKDAEIIDKTSAQISNLVCKCWFSRFPHRRNMEVNSNCNSVPHARHMAQSISQPALRIHK